MGQLIEFPGSKLMVPVPYEGENIDELVEATPLVQFLLQASKEGDPLAARRVALARQVALEAILAGGTVQLSAEISQQ